VAKKKASNSGHKLNIHLSSGLKQELDRMVETTEAGSAAEVIRKAILLYGRVLTEQSKGSSVCFMEKGGEVTKLFIP